jgi:hypothetical protein
MSTAVSPLKFVQSSQESSLYVAQGGEATPIWCAYVVPAQQATTGSVLTLRQIHQAGGYVVVACLAPACPLASFVQQVQSCAQQLNPQAEPVGLMWLGDANSVTQATVVASCWLKIPDYNHPNTLFLAQGFSFSFGNNLLTLSLPNSLSATVTASDNGLYDFSVPAATAPPSLAAPQLLYNSAGQATTANIVDYFTLSLAGPVASRLLFGAGFATNQIAQFNVGMQYYYPGSGATDDITPLAFPLFTGEPGSQAILADVSLDLLNLLSQPGPSTAPSTYFAFSGFTQPVSGSTYHTVLPTHLLTSGGYQVTLQPTGDTVIDSVTGRPLPGPLASLVVFNDQVPDKSPWVMIPSGSYVLGVAQQAGAGPMELMCGLAGTEVISFTPQADATQPRTGDYLVFQPGNGAYAPGFGAATAASNTDLLTNNYTTAWATVVPGATGTPSYYAQPQGAELYGGATSTTSFLPYFRSVAATLSATSSVFFPLGTYGNSAPLSLFESLVLSPRRRAALGALAPSGYSSAAAISSATTFQGLFVTSDAGNAGNWQRVVLAMAPNPDGNAQLPPQTLAFVPPGEKLQAALQTNQLFLVMSGNPSGAADGLATSNTINIEGWPFTLDLPTQNPYGQFTNVLIFKYCAGTLQNMLSQPALWAQAEQFNFGAITDGFGGLVSWLQDYVTNAISRSSAGDKEYDHFSSIVTRENWQGILGLQVTIGLQDFPPGLEGLLAGIDLSRFSAHHFGIDANVITLVSGQPQLLPSSAMFGLIDYEDAEFVNQKFSPQQYQQQAPIQTDSNYSFKVLSLKVLFQNSRIQSYNSYLALTINQLFGAPVMSTNRQNLLVLAGSYEDHDHHPVYAFNSLPSTASGGYRLELAAGPGQSEAPPTLQAVELVKVTFNTGVASANSQNDSVMAGFTFWGYLDFTALPGFDLLSYGNEAGSTSSQTGLYFANLALHMSFPLATPAAVAFTFDTQQLSFDLSQSTARAGSLARKFPVKLQALLAGDSTSLPSSQNYLPVDLPSLSTTPETSTGLWYGLRFALNMGTLGDLAGAAGFTTQLLLAWNQDGTLAPAGLLLPGVNPQAPFFSLQGILRLDIGSIQLLAASSGDGQKSAPTYLLKLNNIALKLFSLSFPPGGSVSFFLFGAPNATSNPQSLGWYTAYQASTSSTSAALALPASTIPA